MGRPGVWVREGGRYIDTPIIDEWAVDTEDVTGDHGLEDATELRDTLRMYGPFSEGRGGMSSEYRYKGAETRRWVGDFTVPPRSSDSTLVELFHTGRPLSVELLSSALCADGEVSGVRLSECLCDGVEGVTG